MFTKSDPTARIRPEPRNRTDAKDERPAQPGIPSIISADMVVTGDLKTNGEVQVDGLVRGDVRCGSLTVGDHGRIEGNVVSELVRVHGTVVGSIRGRSVTLSNSARISGDIEHTEFEVARGAHFEGVSRRLPTDADLDQHPVRGEVLRPDPALIGAPEGEAQRAARQRERHPAGLAPVVAAAGPLRRPAEAEGAARPPG